MPSGPRWPGWTSGTHAVTAERVRVHLAADFNGASTTGTVKTLIASTIGEPRVDELGPWGGQRTPLN